MPGIGAACTRVAERKVREARRYVDLWKCIAYERFAEMSERLREKEKNERKKRSVKGKLLVLMSENILLSFGRTEATKGSVPWMVYIYIV